MALGISQLGSLPLPQTNCVYKYIYVCMEQEEEEEEEEEEERFVHLEVRLCNCRPIVRIVAVRQTNEHDELSGRRTNTKSATSQPWSCIFQGLPRNWWPTDAVEEYCGTFVVYY